MGLFDNLFKKKEVNPVPTLRDGTPKTFDYFAFKVHGTSAPQSQEQLAKKGVKLHEQPNFVRLALQENVLNVYIDNILIGHGDKQATEKFVKNCTKKRYLIQSIAIYGGDDDKYYGCKVRVKYFY